MITNKTATDVVYKQLIQDLKEKVRSARMRAMLAVNTEQVKLYWEIGRAIIDQQAGAKWGSKVIEQISNDLRSAFPDMKGFSTTNLKRMRLFAESYSDFEKGARLMHLLPWGHIVTLLHKVKDNFARDWYANEVIKNGWSKSVFDYQMSTGLYERQGQGSQKVTNFKERLPTPQSELAHDLIKEPYNFGFLPISKDAKERDIELSLIEHVRKTLQELGQGFAFVGNQYHLCIGGEDFYIDLLFFHIKLNCYFVIELKQGKFKPEYSGKLNFYITAVDCELKEPHHKPTIGLLLCAVKNKVIAEYSLQKMENPIGIAQYELSRKVPIRLQDVLPPVDVLEEKLSETSYD